MAKAIAKVAGKGHPCTFLWGAWLCYGCERVLRSLSSLGIGLLCKPHRRTLWLPAPRLRLCLSWVRIQQVLYLPWWCERI